LALCHDLKQNLNKVQAYLKKDIEILSKKLLDELSEEQRLALLNHWDKATQRGLTTPVTHAIGNRRKI